MKSGPQAPIHLARCCLIRSNPETWRSPEWGRRRSSGCLDSDTSGVSLAGKPVEWDFGSREQAKLDELVDRSSNFVRVAIHHLGNKINHLTTAGWAGAHGKDALFDAIERSEHSIALGSGAEAALSEGPHEGPRCQDQPQRVPTRRIHATPRYPHRPFTFTAVERR